MATADPTAPAEAQSCSLHSPASRAVSAARAVDVPAVIMGSVNLLKFSEALARAGLIGRHDADRGVIVIEPAESSARANEDARTGMRWYNGLSRCERSHWHEVAGSACPADCWRAFQSGRSL